MKMHCLFFMGLFCCASGGQVWKYLLLCIWPTRSRALETTRSPREQLRGVGFCSLSLETTREYVLSVLRHISRGFGQQDTNQGQELGRALFLGTHCSLVVSSEVFASGSICADTIYLQHGFSTRPRVFPSYLSHR